MKQANPIPAAPKPRKPRAKKASAETPTETIQAIALPSETLLHVDLWADQTPDTFQPLAAQMVSDLILGTAGTLQSSTESGLSASYGSTRQAIAAVRNLCLLIDGFSTTGNANIHAAFTLCYADDLEHRSTQPAESRRVLLIGAICDAARTIPGLRFRELLPTATAPHCTTLELLTPAHHQRAAAAPTPAPAALAAPKPLEVSPQTPAKLPVRTPATVPQQSQPAPNPKRRMQIFAAAGAVVLAAIIAFLFIPRTPAKPQPAPAQAPAATPVATVTPPAPTPQPAPPVVATPKPAAETHKQPSVPPPTTKTKQPPPPEPEHETAPQQSSSGVTFSADEIKRMIASADKFSGDGNYDRAITLYDAVLRVDRKNGAALEGRQRAVYNRDHR